jgi:FKBP-type peptidyl-prolyl cis-trans isomerase
MDGWKRLVALAFALILVLAACGGGDDGGEGGGTGSGSSDEECAEGVVETDSGLKYEELDCGDGEEVERGDTVSVHYVGTLEDGTKFDSSRDRGEPFSFSVGAGQVIQGWDEGIPGIKVGGTRKLTIPPDLGYGKAGAPPAIPPNSTLIFEVEVLDIQS